MCYTQIKLVCWSRRARRRAMSMWRLAEMAMLKEAITRRRL